MVDCSSISNVPASPNALKYLSTRFHVDDKNGDGEIDLAQEVFTANKQEQAALGASDINGDGRLAGAEIRYFLNFGVGIRHYLYVGMKTVQGSVKQENPFTEADLNYLVCSTHAEAKPCESKDRNEFGATTPGVFSLPELARTVASTVADKERAAQIFQVLLEDTVARCGSSYRSDDQGKIVSIMAKAGLDKERVTQLLQSRVEAVNKNNEYDSYKGPTLSSLAVAMSQAGVDKEKVAHTFQLALDQNQVRAMGMADLNEIAIAMYRSGMNKDKIAATFHLSISSVGQEQPLNRALALTWIENTLEMMPGLGEKRLTSLRRCLNETITNEDRATAAYFWKVRARNLNRAHHKKSEISGGDGR
jgi:hypothetical protein